MVGFKVSGGFVELFILVLFIVGGGMLVYLWVCFEVYFVSVVLLIVIFDLIKIIGFFVFIGIEFNLMVVVVLLVFIGYFINDKVVVFDCICELLCLDLNKLLVDIINEVVNSMLSCMVFIFVIMLLVLLLMVIFGGDVVESFVVFMVFVVVIGILLILFIIFMLLYLLGSRREK